MTSPIAISVRTDGMSPTDPAIMGRPAVLLEPVAHPDLVAALEGAGATRRGTTTWSYQTFEGAGRNAVPTDHAPLLAALEVCPTQVFASREVTTARGAPSRMYRTPAHRRHHALLEELAGAPNTHRVREATQAIYARFPQRQTEAESTGLIAVSQDRHTIWLRVHTHFLRPEAEEQALAVPLDLRQAGRTPRPPRAVTGAEALGALEWLRRQRGGLDVVDHDGFAGQLRTRGAARRLVLELGNDPTGLLGDDDLLRAMLRVLGGADAVAEAIGVESEVVADAADRLVDVAAKLRETARGGVCVIAAPGRPAKSLAHVGNQAPRALGAAVPHGGEDHGDFRTVEVDASVAAALDETNSPKVSIDPGVLDVARMAVAAPHDDARLYDYQNEMVGRFLATRRGMGNFSAPGAGKTPTTLVGFQAAAAEVPGYRALVVSEANARFQWFDHANEWCPEFRVVVLDSRKQLDHLRDVLEVAGDEPVLAITSYALVADVADVVAAEGELAAARGEHRAAQADLASELSRRAPDGEKVDALTERLEQAGARIEQAEAALLRPDAHLGAALYDVRWHDIAADEVVGLRSSSKTGRALWSLRERAGRALVLTGTPINRDVDDVAKLLSWAFGDRRAFHGARPSERYDLTCEDQARDLLDDLGPAMFRVDKSEIDVELPNLSVEVVPLRLRREELALAEAARTQLKEKFTELMANLELAGEKAEALAASGDERAKDALAEARVALRQAKGAWLGSTTLARQAAADPVALQGSDTAAGELLRLNGLVDAACAQVGTKRRWAVEYIDAAVDAEMQVVLFTEFGTVARALIEDLRERGMAVGEVLGGGGARRDADIRSFRAGELDVLICTSAGERGLNLQTRNGAGQVLVHYDLPWTASGVVQRTGRVERIGGADHVQVVFPVSSGTIEDRVAGLVCARATASLQALDVPRGIEVGDTDFGRALGRLALDVDVTALRGGERALLEMTRALLAEREDEARLALAPA